jgi:putative hemolysin
MPLFEIVIVLALIVFNGVLAMSELAVVSARRAKLKALADRGSGNAAAALKLVANPGRFLSTVQIGITAVGIVAGAFSGSTLGKHLSDFLMANGVEEYLAEPVGYGVVIVAITFVSLVVGELVPKQIALRNAERIAVAVAVPMTILATIASPFVWALDFCGRIILSLLGRKDGAIDSVTEEEIKTMVAEAEHAGVLVPEERQMISRVLRLGDRPVRAVMTPRMDVDILDMTLPPDAARAFVAASAHSRLPVAEEKDGEVVGIVYAKDLLNAFLKGETVTVTDYIRQAPVIPDTMDVLEAVGVLRESPAHFALVHDEYGHFMGIVTTTDILGSIVGEFKTEETVEEPDAVQRDDGSWLLSGSMSVDEAVELLGIKLDPGRNYSTVAGLVLFAMQRLPAVGESVDVSGWRFEVLDLDGRRIDKVMARRMDVGKRVRV